MMNPYDIAAPVVLDLDAIAEFNASTRRAVRANWYRDQREAMLEHLSTIGERR